MFQNALELIERSESAFYTEYMFVSFKEVVKEKDSGAPNVNFRKISVRKTFWDVEFSEHLL